MKPVSRRRRLRKNKTLRRVCKVARSHRQPKQNRHRLPREMTVSHVRNMLIRGGGDFANDMCDFSPLTLDSPLVREFDETLTTQNNLRFFRNLNLKETTCLHPAQGSFNRVCSVKCRENSPENAPKIVQRKTLAPLPANRVQEYFADYHTEMKLQIQLSQDGLAPYVFMYGIALVEEGETSAANGDHVDPQSTNKFHVFAVMEQKLPMSDSFNIIIPLLKTPLPKEDDPTYQELVNKLIPVWKRVNDDFMHCFELLNRLSERNDRIYFDIKMSNIVLDKDRAYLIDCDPKFTLPADLVYNAMGNIPDSKKREVYKQIMPYIFCSRTLALDIFRHEELINLFEGQNFPFFQYMKLAAFLRENVSGIQFTNRGISPQMEVCLRMLIKYCLDYRIDFYDNVPNTHRPPETTTNGESAPNEQNVPLLEDKKLLAHTLGTLCENDEWYQNAMILPTDTPKNLKKRFKMTLLTGSQWFGSNNCLLFCFFRLPLAASFLNLRDMHLVFNKIKREKQRERETAKAAAGQTNNKRPREEPNP